MKIPNKAFTHLHLHTDASLLDGLGTVPRLIKQAKNVGFNKLAMTDHGTLANAVVFNIEAKSLGIKPVLGMEGYIEFDGQIGHITLLANGNDGWNSLLQLNNLAHKSSYKRPAFTIDELIKFNKGLVCLTGCIASPFQQLPLSDAYRLGSKLKSVFGYRLFAELMFVGSSLAWKRPIKIAEKLNLKKVITNDVHFPSKSDRNVHPILTKMKAGFDYDSSQLYLKSYQEMFDAAVSYGIEPNEVHDMLQRSSRIADKLKSVKLSAEPHLPHVSESSEDLATICKNSDRWKEVTREFSTGFSADVYRERLAYELGIISEMDYADYFIILDDLLKAARKNNVKIGPGRGSGAGSLILYLMEITEVDPIEHGLKFERFLNPERKGMPDVDIDLESERRELVLDYAAEKYGAVPIATYSRYSHKSLTRDLCRMFRVDKDLTDKAADGGPNSDAFDLIVRDNAGFDEAYEALMGQIRHKGKHAGGVIITDTTVPIERVGDTLAAAWTEGLNHELSYAGIVKFDLLGLSVLSALRELEEKFDKKPDKPTKGHEVFEIFRKGDLSGIFQFAGSEGIRDLTIDLEPDDLNDLVAINALYRPGAIDAGSTWKYSEWKKKPRKVPSYISDILEPTYGAIVYQEQVMEIFQRTVGGSLGTADLARRTISKAERKLHDPRHMAKVEKLGEDFVEGAIKNHGLSERDAKDIWKEIKTHTRYSFNKSHSTAYAMIAWQCAWWKYYHPADFYAAMLNVDSTNEQTYIIDAVSNGIEVVAPHVNVSGMKWNAKDEKIFMPLSAVKFLGESGVNSLIESRKLAGGKFENLEHFMNSVPKRFVRARARIGLYSLGGFKGLFEDKSLSYAEDVLEVKEIPLMKDYKKRQLKYLGFIIPNSEMLKTFRKLESNGWICGVIDSSEKRTSKYAKYGDYMVYRLSPNGVFWTREAMDLQDGQVIAVKIGGKGKAKKIRIL